MRVCVDGRTHERTDARTRQRLSGFTLVEVLIVTLLLFIVGGGLLSTFLTGQASFLSGEAYVQVQQEARRAFDAMVRELREAGMLTNPITTLANPKQLNFQVALDYNAGAVQWGAAAGDTGAWLHYAIKNLGSGAQLIRYRTGPGTEQELPPNTCAAPTCRVLANNVRLETGTSTTPGNTRAADTFLYDATNKVVTINLQCERNDPKLPGGRQATPVLSSRVKLRNN